MAADPRLDDFEDAWTRLREAVNQAESDGERPTSDELASIIDKAIRTRTHARMTLAQNHGSGWLGDQELFEREVRVGALARVLDGFVEAWPLWQHSLNRRELLYFMKPLLVEPGSHDAHQP